MLQPLRRQTCGRVFASGAKRECAFLSSRDASAVSPEAATAGRGATPTSKVASKLLVKEQVTKGRQVMRCVLTFKENALPAWMKIDKAIGRAYTIEHLRAR